MPEHGRESKRILIACHDRGGANAIMALLANAWFSQHQLWVYLAGPALQAYADAVKRYSSVQNLAELANLQFDAIITGSSHTANLEREVLLWAAERDIPSCCVIDSWMNLSQRFWHPAQQKYCFPSLVSLIDQQSYGRLLQELADTELDIVVGGQPYLANMLEQAKPLGVLQSQAVAKTDAGNELATTSSPRWLFCSEPMKMGYNQQGELGFDEWTVFTDLVKTVEQQKMAVQLFIRLHPAESPKQWQQFLANMPVLEYVELMPLGETPALNEVDLVIGMASMMLLEAVLQGKRTLSCQFSGRFVVAPQIVQWTELCHSPEQLIELWRNPATQPPHFSQLQQVLQHSSQRISVFIASLLQPKLTLRTAELDDMSLYFDWANDPVVRQMAFNSKPIEWPQHQQWFRRKIADPQVLMLVVERVEQAIGQVRLERHNESGDAVLDYSLAADARGQGLASILLQKACHHAFQQGFCRRIWAEVKPQNQASARALLTAGFYLQSSPSLQSSQSLQSSENDCLRFSMAIDGSVTDESGLKTIN